MTELERLRSALEQCREVFKRYAEIHAAKETLEGAEKATANLRYVQMIDVALGGTE